MYRFVRGHGRDSVSPEPCIQVCKGAWQRQCQSRALHMYRFVRGTRTGCEAVLSVKASHAVYVSPHKTSENN